MRSNILLAGLGLLLLSCLSSVSPYTKHLTRHQRNVRARDSLRHSLRTSSTFFNADSRGLTNDLGGKTLTLSHQKQRASSKFILPDIKDFTNNIKDGMSSTPWERQLQTFSKSESPASRHDHLSFINTVQLLNGAKRKRQYVQVSKIENQQDTDNKFLAPRKYRSRSISNPEMPNNSPTFVFPYSEEDREKRASKWYTVTKNAKDRQQFLPAADGFKNPTHDDSTLYNVEADEEKSSHGGKAMSQSSKNRNLVHPGKTYQMSLPAFSMHYMIQNSEGKNKDIPTLNEERHTVAEHKPRTTGTRTLYLHNNRPRNVRKYNHEPSLCGNCICSHTDHDKIVAKCTDEFIRRFPDDLPTNTWQLILLGNHIQLLNMTHINTYPLLSKLTISKNTRLKSIEKAVDNMTTLIKELDLSENNITFVGDNSFKHLPHLLTLNLFFNHINTITNLTFAGVDNLRSLNLSRNRITHTDSAAFDNLRQLKTLDLSQNKNLNACHKVLTPKLMKSLKNLTYLLLQGSSFLCTYYPNLTLKSLKNLRRLSIDGLHSATFGPEISSLKNLTHLDIGFNNGECHITNINEFFFQNLPHLVNLTLTKCYGLRKIESFMPEKPLCKTLRHLRIEQINEYNLTTALQDLKAFNDSSLQSLALVALYRRDGNLPCRFLSKENANYIKNHPLQELDLSGNGLSVLTNDFIAELPKTLKRLILTDNMLTLDGLTLQKLSVLNNLIEVDTSYQNMDIHNFPFENMYMYQEDPEYISTPGHVCQAQHTAVYCSRDKNLQPAPTLKDTPLNELLSTGLKDYPCPPLCFSQGNSTMSNVDSKLRLRNVLEDSTPASKNPPKLQIIRASYHNSFGMRVLSWYSRSKNTFKEIYFSNSFLSKLRHGSLSPSTEIADLSNNYCDSIGTRFFPPNNSLVKLSLQNNVLGEEFANDTNGSIFAELTNTKYLDLRYNVIYNLPQNIFRGLRSLETLKLSKNKLQVLDIRFSHMTSLQTLTLRKNSISWISRESRDDLDILGASHPLQVDLTMNPLPCTCDGLELINWMAKTNVNFKNKADLKCRLGNGKTVEFGDLQERSRSLQHYCASKAVIIVICLASICVMTILVGFSVLYRYRWKLRYLRHLVLVRTVGFKPQQNQVQSYKFDAYILYTEETRRLVHVHFLQELETKRGHRLCISERDFLPGTYDISNIVSAIQNSAKTVVVVTPELYEDEYSEYGIKMAIMEELYKNRDVLHLCMYQPMTSGDMAKCHDLLMVMKRNHYTEYPPDDQATEEIRQNFWDQLSLAIGHDHDPQVPAELELQ